MPLYSHTMTEMEAGLSSNTTGAVVEIWMPLIGAQSEFSGAMSIIISYSRHASLGEVAPEVTY